METSDALLGSDQFKSLSWSAQGLYRHLKETINGTPVKVTDLLGEDQTTTLAFVELKSEGFILESAGFVFFSTPHDLTSKREKEERKKEAKKERRKRESPFLFSKEKRKRQVFTSKKQGEHRPATIIRRNPDLVAIDTLPVKAQPYLRYWYSKKFTIHKAGSKILKKAGKDLKQLAEGTFFAGKKGCRRYDETAFSLEEFKRVVDLYVLRFDEDYLPVNKKPLPRGVSAFLYNPFAAQCISQFVDCLENGSLPLPMNDPEIQIMMAEYKKQFLGDIKFNPSPYDLEKFHLAVTRLKTFFQENKKLYPSLSLNDKVRLLVESIVHDTRDGTKVITPGWLCSERTFEYRLPGYLKKHIPKNESTASISDIERKLNKW